MFQGDSDVCQCHSNDTCQVQQAVQHVQSMWNLSWFEVESNHLYFDIDRYSSIFNDIHRLRAHMSVCLAVWLSGSRRSVLLQLFETSAQSTSAWSTSAAQAQHKRSNALKHVIKNIVFQNLDLQIASKCGSIMFKKYPVQRNM